MKRTRPRLSAARTAAAVALLHLAAIAMLPSSPAATARAAAVPDGVVVDNDAIEATIDEAESSSPSPSPSHAARADDIDDRADEDALAEYQRLLDSYTSSAAAALQRKSSEFRSLQTEFDSKLESARRARDVAERDLAEVRRKMAGDDGGEESVVERTHEDMSAVETEFANLLRRTEGVLAGVGEYNRRALGGRPTSEEEGGRDAAAASAGLAERLAVVMEEEMERRDRYNANMTEAIEAMMASIAEDDAGDEYPSEPEASIEEDDGSSNVTAATNVTPDDAPSPYITVEELESLLSAENVLTPSETALKQSLAILTSEQLGQILEADDEMWKSRFSKVSSRYEEEFAELKGALKQMEEFDSEAKSKCLAIPTATEMVGRALVEHHRGGTGGLFDHASYENGGSVAYELTSAAHVPPPRNDEFPPGDERAAYEREKQKMFDEQTEGVYRQRRAALADDERPSLMKQASEFVRNVDFWGWYSSFKFGELRPHLPDDWERLLDGASDRLGGSRSWSDYTPHGAMDALVPDYVYHLFGLSDDVNFGRGFGRTASPEVAISAGRGKGGGGDESDGWTSKPMGQCYPLSMSPSDDPAPSLLARRALAEGIHDEDVDTSLLAGPKFTVRLPRAVYIDAVTLEHRSFPLPPSALVDGQIMGGESAPRWVRVVGFPPCPGTTSDGAGDEEDDDEEDECGARGFDVTKPVDLGSFEYQRITVTGREDDYGGGDEGDEDEEDGDVWPGGRRRSIQTFAVKGGKWKQPSLFDENEASGGSRKMEEEDEADPAQCSEDSMSCEASEPEEEEDFLIPEAEMESLPEPGQCAPPKDENSLPSCGDDVTSSTSSSEGNKDSAPAQRRHVVEAVSFIIEENWGNREFTCLYRVRVHGDAVLK